MVYRQRASQQRKLSFAPSVGRAGESRPPATTTTFEAPMSTTGSRSGSSAAAAAAAAAKPTQAEFWQTAPTLHQLTADPSFLTSATLRRTLAAVGSSEGNAAEHLRTTAVNTARPAYIDVDGPVNPADTLIRYDIPFAPDDPKRSLRLRRRLGMMPGAAHRSNSGDDRDSAGRVRAIGASATAAATTGLGANNEGHSLNAADVDPNVRAVLDAFIVPRRWVDAKTGVVWVQHAWPFPCSRTATVETEQRLQERLLTLGARRTGTCPIRTVLVAECFLEVMRQVVTECWERGLLLLHVHAERVAAQAAHRELFESRVGHAMRLALKGEKDAMRAEEDIAALKEKVAGLEAEERELRARCNEFAASAEEHVLIEEKKHSEALSALRKEGLLKRNQLEQMLALPSLQ